MLASSRLLNFTTRRGAGTVKTRGNPVGDYGIVDVKNAPAMPKHVLDKWRLENQRHIKTDTTRTRQYVLCSRCGVSNVVINFEANPSARIGMFGVCEGGKDFTHHKFKVISQGNYKLLQQMTPKERVAWFFAK